MRHVRLLAALVLAGACSVGEVPGPGGDDSGGGDGGINPRTVCADRGTAGTPHDHIAAGGAPAGPRAGLSCQTAGGCHGPQPGAGGAYSWSGSAFKEIGGTTAQAGVVVRVFKENPTDTFTLVSSAVTDTAGNFYVTDPLNDYPYITDITACGSDALAAPVPGIRSMVTKIQTGQGNCNGGTACHQVPGLQAIYLAD